MRNTKAAIVIAYMVGPLLCIPSFLAFSVHPKNVTVDNYCHIIQTSDNVELTDATNITIYVLKLSELSTANGGLMTRINFCVYGVVIKLIPCVALTELSRRLICAMGERKRKRQQLNTAPGRGRIRSTTSSIMLKKERQANRTTTMLLAVLILFLITEIP